MEQISMMKNDKEASKVLSSRHKRDDGPEKRELILKAAESLFIRRGFDGVSVMDVASEAGVAKALVFYHFHNKSELFAAVLDRYYTEQGNILKSAVSVGGTVRERMHAGIDAYLDYIGENPGYPRLIQGEICTNIRGLDKMVEHMKPLSLWGEALMSELLPGKGHLSPKHLFISLYGMISGYYTYSPVIEKLWQEEREDRSEEKENIRDSAASAIEERRKHIHWLVDAIMDKLEVFAK